MPPRSLVSLAGAALALSLAACSGSAPTPPPSAEPAGPDTCGISGLQGHVGELLDVTLLQVFESAVPSHRVLVLKPDTVTTDEVVPERAKVKTDNKSIITAITCG